MSSSETEPSGRLHGLDALRGGALLLEIGYTQSEAVQYMFDRRVWRRAEILPDLQGIPRMVRAQII